MKARLNQAEIIERFIATHGDRYDYSLVEYNGMRQKVKIICKEHGIFEQIPYDHYSGHGCSICGKNFACQIKPTPTKLDSNLSYLLGFIQTDGHRSKSTNAIYISLSYKDIDILSKIKEYLHIPNDIRIRIRDTNFKKQYKSCEFSFSWTYISEIINFIPSGEKSFMICPPPIEYSEIDYWRGVIDGDGSLGFRYGGRGTMEPYISLITKSDDLAIAFQEFVFKKYYSKNNSNKNKRDNCYNIALSNVNAQKVVNDLYYNNCFSLDRKIAKAKDITNFIIDIKNRQYSRDDDIILLTFPFKIALEKLNRHPANLKRRLKLLTKHNIFTVNDLYDRKKFI